nr:MAG TPA: hypothetical protein [Caudoviricetes sp.]
MMVLYKLLASKRSEGGLSIRWQTFILLSYESRQNRFNRCYEACKKIA